MAREQDKRCYECFNRMKKLDFSIKDSCRKYDKGEPICPDYHEALMREAQFKRGDRSREVTGHRIIRMLIDHGDLTI